MFRPLTVRINALAISLPLVFLLMILSWPTVLVAKTLQGGPPFGDPTQTTSMPESWIQQPITRGLDDAQHQVDMEISMDQQLFRILGPGIHQYAQDHHIRIALRDGTCGNTASAMLNKTADIGIFCCPPRVSDRLPGLRFITLGITSIAILIHPDNPIHDLSENEVRAIFAGERTRWSEFTDANGKPGPNTPITPVARLHCKTRPGHWRLILGHEDEFSAQLQEVGAIPDMISTVAKNQHAIGHASYWFANSFYKDKGKVNALHINGASPWDIDALASGKYPFYKTFSMALWESKPLKNPHAEGLIAFLQQQTDQLPPDNAIASSSRLRKAGWQFLDQELVGEAPK